jgi:hypothetical protein
LVGLVVGFCASAPAWAGSHSWRIAELFTNADGTVQFIELKECCGMSGENFISGLKITSQATGLQFTFPSNVSGSTAGKRMLLATDAFTTLAGAPARDFEIPPNFFGLSGDTLRYNPGPNYDTFIYTAGQLPTDGFNSIQLTAFAPPSDTFITAPNNPTNYDDDPGQVNAGCTDNDDDGYGSPASPVCENPEADCDDNNELINPEATELCTDNVDNDCDGDTDCEDADCDGMVGCIPTMSEWGVVVLLLLLMISGALLVPRRGAVAT